MTGIGNTFLCGRCWTFLPGRHLLYGSVESCNGQYPILVERRWVSCGYENVRGWRSIGGRPPIDLQPNVVYKISCADCPWSYLGETGRSFETRRNIWGMWSLTQEAKHAWSSNHSIDFENSQVIDKGSSRTRKTLESWHTASIDRADNNSRPLPNQYSILLKNN